MDNTTTRAQRPLFSVDIDGETVRATLADLDICGGTTRQLIPEPV